MSTSTTKQTLTLEDVKKTAKLARIKMHKDEIPYLHQQLQTVLNWIDQLSYVDTAAVNLDEMLKLPPTLMRQDEVADGNIRDEILANSPTEPTMGFFVVPKMIE